MNKNRKESARKIDYKHAEFVELSKSKEWKFPDNHDFFQIIHKSQKGNICEDNSKNPSYRKSTTNKQYFIYFLVYVVLSIVNDKNNFQKQFWILWPKKKK